MSRLTVCTYAMDVTTASTTDSSICILSGLCVQVHNVAAPAAALQAPQGDCCEPAPMPAPPSEAVVKREQKIREVHVSAALMEEFLR